jgi:6-phosphofructokinase 1/ribokinase
MNFLTVVGHVNVDIVLKIRQIPAFGSEEIKNIERRLGGTGANIARYAAALGTPVNLISRVSSHFPEDMLFQLRNDHIKLTLETTDDEGPFCYIADAGDNQIAYMYQGPMNHPGKDYEIDSKYCHFATSNPEWILRLMARSKSIRVLDPGQEIKYRWKQEKIVEALRMADLVILNEAEFNYLSSFTRIDGEKTIVTLGSKGVIFNDELIQTERVDRASSLGAGDMFRAAFYSSLYRGKDMKRALICATKVTSFHLKNGMDISKQFDWDKNC